MSLRISPAEQPMLLDIIARHYALADHAYIIYVIMKSESMAAL